MADDAPKPISHHRTGCRVWVTGVFVAGFIGFVLAFFVMQANAPGWVFPLVFFGPPILFTLVCAAIYLPRFIREIREAARNAPSPESVAAKARGEGVAIDATPNAILPEADDDAPAVPAVETAPGRVLAHNLPRADLSPGCQFGCAVLMALVWNGIVSVFVVNLVRGWNRIGGFKWLQVAFLVPFVIVGLVLIVAVLGAAYKWVVSWFVGQVEVEVSAHPLAPGAKVRVRVAQRGLVPLRWVTVSLVCIEEVTYVAGTSTSTEKKEVARHALADPDDHPGGLPLEFECAVPADTMHSFEAPNNKIKWTVRVTAHVLGLPFRDDYSVVISPE
jgi:hypothetical protein